MASTNKNAPPINAFDRWWQGLPPDKRRECKPHRGRLLRLFQKPQQTDVRWWHDVGVCLNGLFPPDEPHPGLEAIADLIEPKRDRAKKSIITNLNVCRKSARVFHNRDLCRLEKLIYDERLTANHVRT